MRVLIIGYGNPGRLDDGLGPAFADAIGRLGLPDVTVDSDYQLMIEDAAEVAKCDVVIFADASVSAAEPFTFERIAPLAAAGFTTHHLEPAALMAIAADLFGAKTIGHLLAIRGYEFDDFGEGLSERARANLAAAVEALAPMIRTGRVADLHSLSLEGASCKTASM